ncbi:Bgt-51271 [Blumeria graminis f. sp. tritici]|uniref:Bgt-51271 n=1 Tax=Blumeria graminis f. sp. tritici TaxID=62690 RepID=A0A9X9PQM4_BLUGR|nr:Bgt-51271 [Blumeria graminis f. sp. tritici]
MDSSYFDTLRRWYKGEAVDMLTYKAYAFSSLGFQKIILKEFSPKFGCLKFLAIRLRNILFE